MSTETTDPGVVGWRVGELERHRVDHEDRLRKLERAYARVAAVAAAGATIGSVVLAKGIDWLLRSIH